MLHGAGVNELVSNGDVLGGRVLAPCILKIIVCKKALFYPSRAIYIREKYPCVYIRSFAGTVEKMSDPSVCGESRPDPSVVRPVSESLCYYGTGVLISP